ncbi:MAG: GUN4 N-terminal ARM-like repeat domain-containing protein [Leptolyngbyaceae bacterium]|nr:GUN4 N-terminal ARM-like repeat domain-containing protein [Leptolyngbyaceae bacterium]
MASFTFSADGVSIPVSDLPVSDVQQLRDRLEQGSSKQKFQAIQELAAQGQIGETVLMDVLRQRVEQPITAVEGAILQVLTRTSSADVQTLMAQHWGENGLIPLPSERNIDYSPIQQALIHQEYEAADRLTLQKMCELAGPVAAGRKWLYFSDVDQFPVADLQLLDRLWRVYSEDKFGFSIQRELWIKSNQDWERLWPKIGWKGNNGWTRYPHEFTWDLSAPKGHLPLSNQLRGVRVMASLMKHPAWN